MTRRTDRVNGVLRQEISLLLSRELNDPRLSGVVSVTRVETSGDLHYSRVFISVLGSRDDKVAALDGVRSATGFMRRELRTRLSLRQIPELHFSLDESIEEAEHLFGLIDQLTAEASPQTGSVGEDRKKRMDYTHPSGRVKPPVP